MKNPSIPQQDLKTIIASIDKVAAQSGAPIAEKSQRDLAVQVLFLRGAGTSISETARRTGLARNTVVAITERHPEAYSLLKRRSACLAASVAEKAWSLALKRLDQLDQDGEALGKVQFDKLVLGAAISSDKSMQLNADLPEVQAPRPQVTFESYTREVERFQREKAAQKARAVEADVIEDGGDDGEQRDR